MARPQLASTSDMFSAIPNLESLAGVGNISVIGVRLT